MRVHTENRRGQTAVLFTLAIVPLLGILGLVVDVGWMYYRRQAAQTAADAAASAAAAAAYQTAGGGPSCTSAGILCSGAEYVCSPNPSHTPTNNLEVGCLYAKENGFVTAGRQRVTMQAQLGSPPTATGVVVSYWIVARVSETVPQLFSRVLGFGQGTVSARATTGIREGNAGGCVITLHPNAVSMVLSGTVSLTSGCGVYVNSTNSAAITTNGGGTITTTGTARTQIVGGCNGCENIHPGAQTGVPVFGDPFGSLAPPPPGISRGSVNLGSQDELTIDPGTYDFINLGSHAQLTLRPGIYTIHGNISLTGQPTIRGSGVMIYLENGGVSMTGGSNINLTAPTSGDYQGILFYQARGNTTESTLVGGTAQSMNGVLYFPSAHLTYTGGSALGANETTIVASTLSMVGNSYMSAAATTHFTGVQGGAFMVE